MLTDNDRAEIRAIVKRTRAEQGMPEFADIGALLGVILSSGASLETCRTDDL